MPDLKLFSGNANIALARAVAEYLDLDLGRAEVGGDAVALIEVDAPAPDAVMEEIRRLPQVKQASTLTF